MLRTGKEEGGAKYQILYRIINCLDCKYPEDGRLISLYHSSSPMNEEVKHKIKLLERRKLTFEEIAVELQYIYGNNIISKGRDEVQRVN